MGHEGISERERGFNRVRLGQAHVVRALVVCEQARELPVKLKMTGDHKIHKLDPAIHRAAKQAMRLVTTQK